MWKTRIEQYFQVIEQYFQVIENGNTFNALWEVIENGNSFKLVPRTTTNADGTSTSTILGHVTAEEKAQKKNDLKARSMLLMALPNEHLLTFSQIQGCQDILRNCYPLAILGEIISQEDLNLKLLKSLPAEWNTHVVVWRNKPDLDTMSFDDLHNNFKIVEQEVKRTVTTSSSSGSQNMALKSNTWKYYEFEYKLIFKLMLSAHHMRARRFYQKTGKKITINGRDTAGYDKPRNQDSLRKTVHVEETSSKAMIAIDGAGFDWSFMADEEAPTNMALMAFSDLEVLNDKTCSNTCLKAYETLKTQHDNLRIELNKSEFDLATYKRGLASVEEQLVFYKEK
ncbi:hypothetical protein Tco_0204050 [Tanacetum coccineum]